MAVPLWAVRVGLEQHDPVQRNAVLRAFRHVNAAVNGQQAPALEVHVRARSREEAVDYVHAVLNRERVGMPAVTRVIDLREEDPGEVP